MTLLKLLSLLLSLLAWEDDPPQHRPEAGGVEPIFLNNRSVQIQFQVEERGAADLTAYSLYFTTDGGDSWQPAGEQPYFGGSPYPFTAPSDGYFGFYLTARNAAGLEEPPPPAGTPPRAEVIIDTTAPRLRLLAPVDEELFSPSLPFEIAWEADDENLPPYPVELAYSVNGGPWVEIWANAPGQDSRQWVPPFTEGSLALRLRARDYAGNRGEFKTVQPLTLAALDHQPPAVMIVPPCSRRLTVPVYYRIVPGPDLSIEPAGKGKPPAAAGGEASAPARLRKVQLWYRQPPEDWKPGDLDLDLISPAYFQAPGDGVFLLLVVAEDETGELFPKGILAADKDSTQEAPRPSVPPHGKVLIDTQEPRLRIIEPPSGTQINFLQAMRLRFEIEEENPLKEAPEIRYSVNGGQSWTSLPVPVQWTPLKEKGHYLGECQLQLPAMKCDAFQLEIIQRDIAGNVGRSATSSQQPISVRDLEEDPRKEAVAYYRKALLLLNQGDDEKKRQSLKFFEATLKKWEPFAEAHHDLGVALEQTAAGKADLLLALQHYRRAIEIDPAHLPIRFSVIRCLLSLSKNPRFSTLERESHHQAAYEEFSKINWPELLNPPKSDQEGSEMKRFRTLYLLWKEKEFQGRKN